MDKKIIFSVVLYKTNIEDVNNLLNSIINFNDRYGEKYDIDLLISDNSPSNVINQKIRNKLTLISSTFTYNYKNIGFGAGHNRNIFELNSIHSNSIIIILNPDIKFRASELINIVEYSFKNFQNVSCLSPLIYNSKNKIQYTAKKNPTFMSLIIGRISFFQKFKLLNKYLSFNQNKEFNYKLDIFSSTYLSGCFLILPSWSFLKLSGFDENFFLHFEDADLVRRCSFIGKTLHYPKSSVFHKWERGSHKSFIQTLYLLKSYIYYLIKWGFEFY
tara:strand:- start:10190 stop:11008 length:819 start_codon:yes stop_codon:yes gene_type:complete